MKKIRYAAEFFESLFRSKRERKALARLSKHAKKIQDALGSLNDFIADRKMAAEAALHAPRKTGAPAPLRQALSLAARMSRQGLS